MITLIEGNVGSGKTYFAVREVLGKYYTFSENELKWLPREGVEFSLYSNVDGFLVAKDLNEVIAKAGGVSSFFTVEYQAKFSRLNKHIYVIDEVQQPDFFHRKFYDPKVFYFFQYHRHFGIDIYMITQDISSLARELQCLPEYHIVAVRRSYSFAKEFRYHYMVGNDIFRRKTYRTDLKVFSAFRSSTVDSSHQVESYSKKYFIYIGFFVFVVFGGFYGLLKWRFSPPSDVKSEQVVESMAPGQFKIVALCSDNAVVKNLASKKLQRVSYSVITGDLRIGAIVNVSL